MNDNDNKINDKNNNKIKLTFFFIRHGESCQNLIRKLKLYPHEYASLFLKNYDPTLSDSGKIDSIKYGKKLPKFDIIGSSPMLRAIETAYFMTNRKNRYQKIHVFPYLRETLSNFDSKEELNIVFPMKSIDEQKSYLLNEKISNINFNYVSDYRDEPGDIEKFIKWFAKEFDLTYYLHKKEILIGIFIHSNVIYQFNNIKTKNNDGFKLKSQYNIKKKEISYNKENMSLINHNYNKNESIINCPTLRCKDLCEYILKN